MTDLIVNDKKRKAQDSTVCQEKKMGGGLTESRALLAINPAHSGEAVLTRVVERAREAFCCTMLSRLKPPGSCRSEDVRICPHRVHCFKTCLYFEAFSE